MDTENSKPGKLKQSEWLVYIQAWENSGKKQALYCQENDLSLTTFGYWRTCYLKKKKQVVPKKTTTFIPVKLAEVKPVVSEVIHASFTSGLQLRLPLSMPLEEMIRLLKSLEHPHAN